jgi:hypothetical protein
MPQSHVLGAVALSQPTLLQERERHLIATFPLKQNRDNHAKPYRSNTIHTHPQKYKKV